MTEPLSFWAAILAMILSGTVIFLERLFPFALFSKKEPPAFIRFIEKYIPSMIIAILVIYSLKDVSIAQGNRGIPYWAGILTAAFLHLAFKNPMVSVFGSTGIYMVLLHVL